MSSNPTGLCFSPYSSPAVPTQHIATKSNNNSNNEIKNKSMIINTQQQPQLSIVNNKDKFVHKQHQTISTHSNNSISDSEADISSSNENLSMERRYVLRLTSRVEPQGQENLPESMTTSSGGRFITDQRFLSNASTDSSRYGSSNRSMSETRNTLYNQLLIDQNNNNNGGGNTTNSGNNSSGIHQSSSGGNNSIRNSVKEIQSNRSSMDVSTCSYNTFIIHNDDSIYSINNSNYSSPSEMMNKKDRPRSYGEQTGLQEVSDIPDDYLNKSHVLKHLAKEIRLPMNRRSHSHRDSGGQSENIIDSKEQRQKQQQPPPKYHNSNNNNNNNNNYYNNYINNNNNSTNNSTNNNNQQWIIEELNEQQNNCSSSNIITKHKNKMKSKSQPDLTKLIDIDIEAMEVVLKENQTLKQQLNTCLMKVAKTQKLEEEVTNIYRVHEELVKSCERREKLERACRLRLQSDLQCVKEVNIMMKDQVELLQGQMSTPTEHQMLIAQLFNQNKELSVAKERQTIELDAQHATLQEQRKHIGILDTALTNAQNNIRRLEDELRKKHIYIERLSQLHGALQSKQNHERKLRLELDNELINSKDSNRSGSSTNSNDIKWQQIHEKNNQIMRLETEQRQLEEQAKNIRQNVAKISTMETNSEDDRTITEAKHDKLRYLEEVHSAQRKVNDLQSHLKMLESKLVEKDTEIRLLQEKKLCGSSFDSYNSYGINRLNYNSQTSIIGASNASFNAATNTSLLEQTYGNSNNGGNSGSGIGRIGGLCGAVGNISSNNSAAAVISNGLAASIQATMSTVNCGGNNTIVGADSNNSVRNGVINNGNTVVNGIGVNNSNIAPNSSSNYSNNNSNNYDPTLQYLQQQQPQEQQPEQQQQQHEQQQQSSTNYDLYPHNLQHSHHALPYDNLERDVIAQKQLDEQLISKVSQLSLVNQLLAKKTQKQLELQQSNNMILNQIKTSKELSAGTSCRDITIDKEVFY